MNHKISIVTPTLNQGNYLEQTIDSVLSQDYPELEYIIIDGGSNDNTLDIIKRYERYLKYWISEPDNGQSDAINKGFNQITGSIFNWLNSDDFYEPETLSFINESFQDNKIKMVGGTSRLLYQNGDSRISKGTFIDPDSLSKTIGNAQIDQPPTFFRTTAVQEFYPLNEQLRYLMDREKWIKYLLKHGLDGIIKTEKPLVNFRIHEESKTGSESYGFNIERETIFLCIIRQLGLSRQEHVLIENFEVKDGYHFQSNFDIDQSEIKNAINYYFILLFDESYAKGNFKLARLLSEMIDTHSLTKSERSWISKLKFKNSLKGLFK